MLLQDLTDPSQPRFGELVAQTKLTPANAGPVTPIIASAPGSALAQSLASLAELLLWTMQPVTAHTRPLPRRWLPYARPPRIHR